MNGPEPARGTGRTRLLLIMGVVVLAAAGVTVGSLYRMAHRDSGVAQRGDVLPELCEIVSPETLAKARTTVRRPDPRAMSGHVVRKETTPDVPALQATSRAVLDEVLGKL